MRLVPICIVLSGALIFPAYAHTGVGPVNSFSSGVAHPLSGADHLIAMTMVGLWSVLHRWPCRCGVASNLRGSDVGRLCSGTLGPANRFRRGRPSACRSSCWEYSLLSECGRRYALGAVIVGSLRVLPWARSRNGGGSSRACPLCSRFRARNRRAPCCRYRSWFLRPELGRKALAARGRWMRGGDRLVAIGRLT